MYCKYLSRKINGTLKCKFYKKDITNILCCQNCSQFNLMQNKGINKVSKKQKKLNNNRFSIFTNKFDECYYCGKQNIKLDLHEVYGGSNRKRSHRPS